jgi:hypothetical protein
MPGIYIVGEPARKEILKAALAAANVVVFENEEEVLKEQIQYAIVQRELEYKTLKLSQYKNYKEKYNSERRPFRCR